MNIHSLKSYPDLEKGNIFVHISITVFFLAAFIVTIQKFLMFSNNADYQFLKSLIYNTLVFVPFGICIIPSIKLQQRIKNSTGLINFFKLILFSLGVILLYPIFINIILYEVDLLSRIISEPFLRKYFTGAIQIHLPVLFSVQLILFLNRESLYGRAKLNLQAEVLGVSSTVFLIESYDHYVKIYTSEQVLVKRMILKKLASELPDNFVRIHRKYIVNIDQVQKLYRQKRIMYIIVNEQKVRVSRSNEKKVKALYLSRKK